MPLRTKITAALKDNWLTRKEFTAIAREAQTAGVKSTEHAAVANLRAKLVQANTKAAAGTLNAVDGFLARHEPTLNVETSNVRDIAKALDTVDFWYGRNEASVKSVKALPPTVYNALVSHSEAEGDDGQKWEDAEFFSLPIGNATVYGAAFDDGGHSGGFHYVVITKKGRVIWELSGQND
jgi:ABC-type transporter Mla subunit MlaD